MRADVRRSIGTVFAVVLVLVLSGCAVPIPTKFRNAPKARTPSAQTASTYQTTHCTDNGVFRCSSSNSLSGFAVPQLGACAEQTRPAILGSMQGPSSCQVRLTMWVAVPMGSLNQGAEACAEPLLNFRLIDNSSRTIGSGAPVAGVLHQAAHPALVTPTEEAMGTSCAVVWR